MCDFRRNLNHDDTPTFDPGTDVQARYLNGDAWHVASIAKRYVNEDSDADSDDEAPAPVYDVAYPDGRTERHVPRERIRIASFCAVCGRPRFTIPSWETPPDVATCVRRGDVALLQPLIESGEPLDTLYVVAAGSCKLPAHPLTAKPAGPTTAKQTSTSPAT